MNDLFLIDVDDVLFNTPELKEKLQEYAEEGQELRSPELLLAVHEHEPDFLKRCIYPQAKAFLEKYHGKCVLITSAQSSSSSTELASDLEIAFQKLKLELSGLQEYVGIENIRVVAGDKKEALTEFAERNALFIDNDERHLNTARELGIESAHLLRSHKVSQNPEVPSEFFKEAKFTAGSFAELMRKFEEAE